MTVRTPHRVRRHESGPFAGRPEHFVPHADRQGRYVLADPKIGRKMHHTKHAIYADTIAEALEMVRSRALSIRMRGDLTGQVNLIRPEEIQDL